LIPRETPGVSITPIEHVNLRYTLSSDVHFDDVRLPLSAIVGGEAMWNQGWKLLAGRALDVEKLEVAAVTYGFAAAAVDEAWAYAQERTQFGKPISQHQAIRHKLVAARTKLAACKHMLYHAAHLANTGAPCAIETSMAKLFIADTGVEIALACQQVMGAYGLSDAFDMERHVRDLLGQRELQSRADIGEEQTRSSIGHHAHAEEEVLIDDEEAECSPLGDELAKCGKEGVKGFGRPRGQRGYGPAALFAPGSDGIACVVVHGSSPASCTPVGAPPWCHAGPLPRRTLAPIRCERAYRRRPASTRCPQADHAS
jgi:hypothetical protein